MVIDKLLVAENHHILVVDPKVGGIVLVLVPVLIDAILGPVLKELVRLLLFNESCCAKELPHTTLK